MKRPSLNRLAAFPEQGSGGNPAGVWVGTTLPEAAEMQRIATDVGYSETAFVAPDTGRNRELRYYSPQAQVDFCGHATIATAVALGESDGAGTYNFATNVGEIPVTVVSENGSLLASLTSVEPRFKPVPPHTLADALAALDWRADELDPSIPAALAFAGNWHLVLAVSSKQRLDKLQYDFDKLKQIMLRDKLTTLQLVWRESDGLFHSRNPFPIGGVVEDPATGAAAAALGGYLREANLLAAPAQFSILQGEVMGRPSRLNVTVPTRGGIVVSGTAVRLAESE